jgi:creatinine amidohydrolase
MIKSAPLEEKVNRGQPIYGAVNFRRCYPDGRMGSNPSLATPEHGQRFYELAVKDLSKSYLEFISS